MRELLLVFIVLFSFSCQNQKKVISDEKLDENREIPQENKTLFVASYKQDCEGVSNQSCYLVKDILSDEWELFYSEIEGFDYQAGKDYTLTVEVIPIENPPADGSLYKYKLVSIDQTDIPDYITSGLFDIWGLFRLNGTEINLKVEPTTPMIELNTLEKTFSGSTGCNQMHSSFEYNTKAKSFKVNFPMAMTKRGCPVNVIEPEFLKTLEMVDGYSKKGTTLFLFSGGKQVMEFRRMD